MEPDLLSKTASEQCHGRERRNDHVAFPCWPQEGAMAGSENNACQLSA